MSITFYTKPKSLLTLGLGLLLAIDPTLIFRWVELSMGNDGMLLGRLLGVVYLGIGFGLWCIQSGEDLTRRDALVLSCVDVLAACLVVHAQLNGVMNPLGWGLAAIYLGSALGFAWCAAQYRSKSAYV